jgi:hypothetical protein
VTIVVANKKGGTGKSHVASNLAYALAAAGHRTLLVDLNLDLPSVPLWLGEHEAQPVEVSENLVVQYGQAEWSGDGFSQVVIDCPPSSDMPSGDVLMLVSGPCSAGLIGGLVVNDVVSGAQGRHLVSDAKSAFRRWLSRELDFSSVYPADPRAGLQSSCPPLCSQAWPNGPTAKAAARLAMSLINVGVKVDSSNFMESLRKVA